MEDLKEQLKTTSNLCDIAVVLIEVGKIKLLPTILELIHLESQQIIEEYCVKSEACP